MCSLTADNLLCFFVGFFIDWQAKYFTDGPTCKSRDSAKQQLTSLHLHLSSGV